MNDNQLQKDLQLRKGVSTLSEFSNRIYDILETEPAFATAATVDAMRAFKTLLKEHSNADTETIDISCSALMTALTNAATTTRARLVACNPGEQIIDYDNSLMYREELE